MIGQTILHYKILEKLGEGGMGEVFKAQDTKLERFVALKFLPSELTSSEDDKARFIQEAKAASAMNHPNVCTIHSIDEYNGQLFIVMEYIEGTTLRDNKQVLSEKKILEIAAQAADGLGAAHEKGIVHRDIKPENIMIRKDGIVQIMDFGLAKLYSSSNVSRLTKAGTTMGTMGYMSPEQVQGLDVDHRTDIFSLGVVIYELLSGESPFKGMHETAIMYEIVNVNPAPISTIKNEINPELDQIILECLEKDKDERYQSAKELSRSLRKLKRGSTGSRIYNVNTQAVNTMQASAINKSGATTLKDIPVKKFFSSIFYNPTISWSLAGVLTIGIIFLLFLFVFNNKVTEVQEVKATILPPHGVNFDNQRGSNLTISPDGKYISFIGVDFAGNEKLWVRPVNSLTARPLANASFEAYPFWSPDSKTIAYFDKSQLMKVSLDAGTSLPICDVSSGRGGSWSLNGTIVISPNPAGGLYKVPSSGGKPEEIIKADTSNKVLSLRWPHFLPDGDHFLYSTQSSASGSSPLDGIYLSSLSDTTSVKLINASSNCQYADGYLLFVRQGILLAQKFDPGKLKLVGEAMPLSENVQYYDVRISGTFSSSLNGNLIYLEQDQSSEKTVLLDKNGNEIKKLLDQKPIYRVSFSPDGNKIAYDLYDAGQKNIDIWTMDLKRNVSTRLTFEQNADIVPTWTPDGRQVTYSSTSKGGVYDSYIKNADGSGDATLLFKSGNSKYVSDISPDGNYFLYSKVDVSNGTSGWDIFALLAKGDKKPIDLLSTKFNEQFGTFSPNMKWIAYQSDESGKFQIYIIPFNASSSTDKASGKWQLSVDGGTYPKWMDNGKKIFFFTPDNKIMAVDINESGNSLSPGKPYEIFKPGNNNISRIYAIDKTGTKIIATVPNGQSIQPPVTLVANWQKELEGKK
ncbi:MAG: protein kinase [Ignavibacteriaceae bacterium]